MRVKLMAKTGGERLKLNPAFRTSVQQRNLVAWSHGSFDQNGAIDPGFAFVIASQPPHNFGFLMCRVGVKRNHLAPRVAVHDRDRSLYSNAQIPAHKFIFSESSYGVEVSIDIRAKTPLIQIESQLFAQVAHGLERKDRYRTAVCHRSMRSKQSQLMLIVNALTQPVHQPGIINRYPLPCRRLYIDAELGEVAVDGSKTRSSGRGFRQVAGLHTALGMPVRGTIEEHRFLLPTGEVRKSFRRSRALKRIYTVTVDAGKSDKSFLQFFTAHALDWIAPQALDFANNSHLGFYFRVVV